MSTDTAQPVIDRTTDGATPAAATVADPYSQQALGAAKRGEKMLRQSSQYMRDRAHRASETTVTYIRGEPMKSMLIAAATGATLMAMLSLLTRSRH